MKDYFKKYLKNDCSENDLKSFVELFVEPKNQAELDRQMSENWNEIQTAVDIPNLNDTLYKIHFEINQQEQYQKKSINLMVLLTRIAAILLLPLAIAFFFQIQKNNSSVNLSQTISTPLASKTSFTLPDGSRVWLNSGSSISFPKEFYGQERLVKLSGEAYFDVKKSDHPFRVKTALFTVNVLGTAFNVLAYDHEIPVVTLERGKILLQTKSKNEEILQPGQQAIIDTVHQQIILNNVDTDLFSSWINNQLIFRNEPLATVVRRLERWYNIDIEIKDLSLDNILMTANIEFESVREVMELMELTLPVQYHYDSEKRKLIISKKTP